MQICTRYNLFIHRKKSYQLLICKVAQNLPVLELLNYFIKPSTVAYKRVAYKKHLVYWSPKFPAAFSFLNLLVAPSFFGEYLIFFPYDFKNIEHLITLVNSNVASREPLIIFIALTVSPTGVGGGGGATT